MSWSSEIVATRSGLRYQGDSEVLQDDADLYTPLSFVSPLVLLHNQWHIASQRGIPTIGHLKPSRNVQLLGKGLSFTVTAGTCLFEGSDAPLRVAMKTPNLGSSSKSIKSRAEIDRARCILNEIHILTHLPLRSHRNITQLLALSWTEVPGQEEEITPMLLMEYAGNGTLADLQSSRKSLSYELKMQLIRDVSNGLQALHACGIVHGDVKSENVLVFEDKQGNLTAKVSDFGTASILGVAPGSSTQDDPDCFLSVGTWPWMAPEAAGPVKRSKLHLTDIYSFGLLAWRVLIDGDNPFDEFDLPRDTEAKMAKVKVIKSDLSASHAGMVIGKILQRIELELPPIENFVLMWLFLRTISCDTEERSLSGAMDHGQHQYIGAGYNLTLAPMEYDFLATSQRPECINIRRFEQKIQDELVKAYQSTLDLATQIFNQGNMVTHSKSYMLQCSWLLCVYRYNLIGSWNGDTAHDMLPFVWSLCQFGAGRERQTALSMLFSLAETCSVYPSGINLADVIDTGIQAATQGVLSAIYFLRRYSQLARRGTKHFPTAGGEIDLSTADLKATDRLGYFAEAASTKDWAMYEIRDIYRQMFNIPSSYIVSENPEVTSKRMLQMELHTANKMSELMSACQEGRKQTMLYLLQQGHDADVLNELGEFCLHWLHAFGDHDIAESAKALFEHGADLLAVAIDTSIESTLESARHEQLGLKYRDNPLCRAITTGNLTSVSALMELFRGCNIDIPSKFSIFYEASVLASSLHLAAILEHIVLETESQCKSMLDEPIGQFRFQGWKSHLFRAATLMETEIFRFSMHGAAMEEAMHTTFITLDKHVGIQEVTLNPIARAQKPAPTIFIALVLGSERVCTYLITHTKFKAQIDAVDPNTRYSPLAYAMNYGWVDFFHALVRQGVILDFQDSYPQNHCLAGSQRTYLHLCAELKAPILMMDTLISDGVPVSKVDKYDNTALFVAICKGHTDMARALLRAGEDINRSFRDGFSLLGQIFKVQSKRSVENLEHAVQTIVRVSHDVGQPLDPVVHKEKGLTAVHMAAGVLFEEDQSQRIIDDLVSTFGTEIVNQPTARGSFAIHEAITAYNVSAVEALVRSKADLSVRDIYGNDLLEVARVLMLSTTQDKAEARSFADELFRHAEYMLDVLENAREWPESLSFFKLVRNLEHRLEPLVEHSVVIDHNHPRRQQILNLVADTCGERAVNFGDWIEVFEFGRHIHRALNPTFNFVMRCHFEVDGISTYETEDVERIYSTYPWMIRRVSERQLSGIQQSAVEQYYFMQLREKLRLAEENGIEADLDKEEQLFASLARHRTAANFPYHQIVVKYPGRLSHDWDYALGSQRLHSEFPEPFFDELKRWDDVCEEGSLTPVDFSQEFIDLHFKPPLQRVDLSKARRIKPIFRWNLYCSCVDKPFDSFTDEFVARVAGGNPKEETEGGSYNRSGFLRTADECFHQTHYFTVDMPPPIVRPGFDMEGRPRQPFLSGTEDLDALKEQAGSE